MSMPRPPFRHHVLRPEGARRRLSVTVLRGLVWSSEAISFQRGWQSCLWGMVTILVVIALLEIFHPYGEEGGREEGIFIALACIWNSCDKHAY